MMSGLIAFAASNPSRSLSSTPGRKFSATTSEVAISFLATSIASGFFRSRVRLRLLRFPVRSNMVTPLPLKGSLRRLDRDHIGPEIGQKLHAHRSHQEMVEAQNANALEEIDHWLRFRLRSVAMYEIDFRIFGSSRRCQAGGAIPQATRPLRSSSRPPDVLDFRADDIGSNAYHRTAIPILR